MTTEHVTKRNLRSALFILLVLCGVHGTVAQHQTDTFSPVLSGDSLPFVLDVRTYDVAPAELPTLHSYAAGMWDGKWVLLAGRTNGLHGFEAVGRLNFPEDSQNREVWVIDPLTRQSWSRSLEESSAGLTTAQVASLTPTNNQFFQQDDRLYMTGGYGHQPGGGFTTFSTLTAIDLPELVDWTINGTGQAADHIRQLNDPLFTVTGGSMHEINGRTHLVFGQDFQGGYTPGRNGEYTKQVRSFDIVDDGTTLSVANVSTTPPADEYRRRDLNVVPILQPSATEPPQEALVALSGVFTETFGAWTVPVEIDASGNLSMADPNDATTFKQAMNNYHSAKLGLYSGRLNEMHHILLGGISLHTVDPLTGNLVRDDNMPFTSQMTSVVRDQDGAYRQHYLGAFPELTDLDGSLLLFGANAEFFPAPGIDTFENGVLNLDSITQETVVGYVFGGIVSNAPHTRNNDDAISAASDRIFEVVVTPAWLACDFNGDGVCDLSDLNELLATGDLVAGVSVTVGVNEGFDLNHDGTLDGADLDQWLEGAAAADGLASSYMRGDANLDGRVDVSDFNLWNAAKFTAVGTWDGGDFNGDGGTDVSDFNFWNATKFTASVADPVVPEPAAAALSLVAAAGFAARLRRRCPR